MNKTYRLGGQDVEYKIHIINEKLKNTKYYISVCGVICVDKKIDSVITCRACLNKIGASADEVITRSGGPRYSALKDV